MAKGNMGKGGGRDSSGPSGMGKGQNRSGPPGGMRQSSSYGGKSTGGKSKPSSSAMSKARWDNMTDTMKRKEYGTTSYKKYIESSYSKAGRRQGKVSSSRNKQLGDKIKNLIIKDGKRIYSKKG